jgi:hypothetical protein
MGTGSQFKVMGDAPDQKGDTHHFRYSTYTIFIMEKIINRIEAYHSSYRIDKRDRV